MANTSPTARQLDRTFPLQRGQIAIVGHGPLVIPQVPAAHSFVRCIVPASFRELRTKSAKSEVRCDACKGRGFQAVKQPRKIAGRRIYPAPCDKCAGKGRLGVK